jgi:hypothetical protein
MLCVVLLVRFFPRVLEECGCVIVIFPPKKKSDAAFVSGKKTRATRLERNRERRTKTRASTENTNGDRKCEPRARTRVVVTPSQARVCCEPAQARACCEHPQS